MRMLLSLLLTFLLFPSPWAYGGETAVSGYVMEVEPFFELEESFREQAFPGEMLRLALTDTQTLMFTSEDTGRMLPSLTVMIKQAVSLAENVPDMSSITQSLLETMHRLQADYPDAFLFNEAMAMEHAETGFQFAVAEPDLWLWAQNGNAVMLPIFFYDGESGTLIDGVYLLSIVIAGPESAYYALYNDASIVLDYLTRVEVSSDQGDFQRAVVLWYLDTFVDPQTLEQQPDSEAEGEAKTGGLGSIIITVESGRARAEGNQDTKVVGAVRKDQVYKVYSISDSGWFEIQLEDGTRAFVSPALCERME